MNENNIVENAVIAGILILIAVTIYTRLAEPLAAILQHAATR